MEARAGGSRQLKLSDGMSGKRELGRVWCAGGEWSKRDLGEGAFRAGERLVRVHGARPCKVKRKNSQGQRISREETNVQAVGMMCCMHGSFTVGNELGFAWIGSGQELLAVGP